MGFNLAFKGLKVETLL